MYATEQIDIKFFTLITANNASKLNRKDVSTSVKKEGFFFFEYVYILEFGNF